MKRLNYCTAVILLAFGMLLQNCTTDTPHSTLQQIEQKDTLPPQPILKYTLPVDSFDIHTGTVLRNQNLSHILNEHGVSAKQIYDLSIATKGVFDIRTIRPGRDYCLFIKKDSAKTVAHFVYEISDIDYVVYSFEPTVTARAEKHPTSYREQIGSGIIHGALWNSMKDAGLNPIIALELSDIYAWTIDFFGLQDGDFFKVVYEDLYTDTTYIGFERIKYALFVHNSDSIYAIPFEQDSTTAFFDADGSSLRKAFLKAPLRFSRISSHYSNSRKHPVLKIYRPHHGVDYAAPVGTPVMAIGDGTVISKSFSKGAGYYVKIKHNSVYTTSYLHLSKFGKGVAVGVRVNQGQIIGYVGSTGLATGPHLDFRVFKNGSPIDPLSIKAPPVDPIHEEHTQAFAEIKDSVVSVLRAIPLPQDAPENKDSSAL